MSKDRYIGIVPPIVTPVLQDETVDEAALRRIVRHCRAVGLHSIFTAGSNGECMALTQKERNRCISIVLDEADGKIPVMSGVMDSSTERVIDNIKDLESMGGEVAVVTPVFYARHATQEETVRHFDKILEKTNIKLMLYHIPIFTGQKLTADTMIRIGELDDRVIGIKDSSGDLPGFIRMLEHFHGTDFILLQGTTNLAAVSMLLGADGFVPALAPVFPEPFLKVYEYGKARNIDETMKWNTIMNDICGLFKLAKSQTTSTKYAMAQAVEMDERPILPTEPMTPDEKTALDRFIGRYRQYLIKT